MHLFFSPLWLVKYLRFFQIKSYLWIKINSFELEDAQSGLIHNNYWRWLFQGVIYQIFLLWCIKLHIFFLFIIANRKKSSQSNIDYFLHKVWPTMVWFGWLSNNNDRPNVSLYFHEICHQIQWYLKGTEMIFEMYRWQYLV